VELAIYCWGCGNYVKERERVRKWQASECFSIEMQSIYVSWLRRRRKERHGVSKRKTRRERVRAAEQR